MFVISVARIVVAWLILEVMFFLIVKIWKFISKMIGLVTLYLRGRKLTDETHSIQV